MSENVKTYVFPEGGQGALGGNGMEGMLLGSMMNGGGGFGGGMWNNPIWAIVFLAALRNGGIFGNDNNGGRCQLSQIQEQLQSIQGQNSLMSAIQGGTNEIRSLANTINCDVNAVQGAINAVQTAIAGVGNQVGMGQLQVVNAVQAGNTAIANQIAQCCCDNKLLVTQQGYENRLANQQQSTMIQNGFSQIGYAAAENACAIKQAIADQTAMLANKMDAQDRDRMQREINALTAENASIKARAERAAENAANFAPVYKFMEEVKGKLPNTVSVQWPNLVGVPASQVYGAYGAYGVPGQWS